MLMDLQSTHLPKIDPTVTS